MKKGDLARIGSRWIAFSVLLFLASSASAHHATAPEYDISKTVTLKGTIIRIDWANPHIHVYMQIKSARGVAEEWDVEFPSPGGAIVAGLSKQALANGVVMTFEGYRSKPDFRPAPRKNSSQNGHLATPDHFACATGITLSNGAHFTFVVGI
jgi:hypothetical protein